MIYIIAGTLKQAELCAAKARLAPELWKYVSSYKDLWSLHNYDTIYVTGSYSFRQDSTEIKNIVMERGLKLTLKDY